MFWALDGQAENALQIEKLVLIKNLLETYCGLLSHQQFPFLAKKGEITVTWPLPLTLQFQVNGTTRAQAQEHLQMDVVAILFRCRCMLV